jgi:hypothetical protein
MRSKYLHLLTLIVIGVSLTWFEAAADCTSFLSQARTSADLITVTLETAGAQAGAPVKVGWRTGELRRLEEPAYLVVATLSDVRFAGQGFFALTAGAKGPSGLVYGSDGARAFVPLHRGIGVTTGEIAIRFFRRGLQTVSWGVVTGGNCGEHVLASGADHINVAAGPPELVIQDRFTIETPRQRIRSLTGTHELVVFDGRYEVYKVAGGAKIVDRVGIDPNFSPTGRFIAARATADSSFELIDLITGQQFATSDDGLLAWTRNDSYVIHGGSAGSIRIWNSIVDADSLINVETSCKACEALRDVRVLLDIDHGYFATASMLWRVVDLATREISPHDDAEDDRLVLVEGKKVSELAVTYIRNYYDATLRRLPPSWDVGEQLALSHLENWDNNSEATRLVIRHPMILNGNSLSPEKGLSAELKGRTRSGRYDSAEPETNAMLLKSRQSANSPELVFGRVASSGIPTLRPMSIKRIYFAEVWEPIGIAQRGARMIAQMIRSQVPAARTLFREVECGLEGTPRAAAFIDPRHIAQIWRWTEAGNDRWLVQTICYAGAAGRAAFGDLFLLQRKEASNVTSVIGAKALEGFQVTDEQMRVQVFRVGESQLAVVVPLAAKITIVDMSSKARVGVDIPLIDGRLFSEVRLDERKRHVVQLNKDGRLFVHRISDGRRVLMAAHVDDEIVTATDDGLYDTTFEGAQLVQIRFPGDRDHGLYRFYQFEAALRRPGLAEAVLAGRYVTPPPISTPAPPTAELTLAPMPSEGRRSGRVIATAERDLAAVRLYVDGRLMQSIPVKGQRSETVIDLPDPGGGRWITVVSVDTAGLVSLPSAIQIPGRTNVRGTLRAILVGVDTYEDDRIPQLTYAKADAQRLARALKASEGRSVREVRTSVLSTPDVNPATVLRAISEAAKATGPDDSLVIFYAGHGMNDRRNNGSEDTLLMSLPGTRVADLRNTALPWTALADALADARGTVIVLIDACHSGIAGIEAFITNDRAVSALFTRGGAPMVVLAGSKGRQSSLEDPDTQGGFFTIALAEAIATRRGLIDLSALYAAVKARVMNATNGRQTPWLTRNGLVGEMTVF